MSKMSSLCFILMNFGTFTDIGTFSAPKFQLESFLRWLCCSVYIHGRYLQGSPAVATSDSLFIATVIDHEQAFVVCRAICCAFHIYLVCSLVEKVCIDIHRLIHTEYTSPHSRGYYICALFASIFYLISCSHVDLHAIWVISIIL